VPRVGRAPAAARIENQSRAQDAMRRMMAQDDKDPPEMHAFLEALAKKATLSRHFTFMRAREIFDLRAGESAEAALARQAASRR
jgi:hypothetical protein